MRTQPSTLLDMALSYAARGWPVFPCHTPTADGCSCRRDCGRVGKHPRTQHGLKDATTDETTIRRWWMTWPQANIAITTGTRAGFIVLDEDTYKGGDRSRVELEHSYGVLPETVQQLTGGGGVQYLFAHPGVHVKNGIETLGVGLDIRGDGGYIVAPPSLHVSGQRYAWEVVHEPGEIALAPMPAWLLALCQESTRRESVSAGDPIPKGRRNNSLFKLGCAMRRRGFSEIAIAAALTAINETQCQPPLGEEQVATIAASCAKYEASKTREAVDQQRNGHGKVARPIEDRHLHQTPPSNPSNPYGKPNIITFDTVVEASTEWLWWPYLPLGAIVMLDGDPGLGKSLFAITFAAILSRGWSLPAQQGTLSLPLPGPADTLLLSAEDSITRPRSRDRPLGLHEPPEQ